MFWVYTTYLLQVWPNTGEDNGIPQGENEKTETSKESVSPPVSADVHDVQQYLTSLRRKVLPFVLMEENSSNKFKEDYFFVEEELEKKDIQILGKQKEEIRFE